MSKKTIVTGFDGFVDTLAKAIQSQGTANKGPVYFDTIDSFGRYLCGQAGKSCSVEMDIITRRPGGNAPQVALGAAALGMEAFCIGMLGHPQIDPVFADMPVNMYSYMPPGASTALEFNDGKIFLAPSILGQANLWTQIESATGHKAAEIIRDADALALVNWSEVPFTQQLWESTLSIALSGSPPDKSKYVLFDLCDCTRKPKEDTISVLTLIGKFCNYRTGILSLNENESQDIGKKLGISQIKELTNHLKTHFGIDEIVVHAVHWSLVSTKTEEYKHPSIFVENPLFSTGAGDHFNAAYLYAASNGYNIKSRIDCCHKYVHNYISTGTRKHPSL